MELQLRWDLTSTPKGIYDVVAINPGGQEQILVKGVVVEEASPIVWIIFRRHRVCYAKEKAASIPLPSAIRPMSIFRL
jgi:hypothetical protein